MNYERQLEQAIRHLRDNPVFQYQQYEARQQIKRILVELGIDPTSNEGRVLLDLALDEPEKIIALGQRMAELEREGAGRPTGSTIHDHDEQLRIAAEALELKKKGKKGWKRSICDKYGVSERTLERYLESAKN